MIREKTGLFFINNPALLSLFTGFIRNTNTTLTDSGNGRATNAVETEIKTAKSYKSFEPKFTSYLPQTKLSKHFYEKVIHCNGCIYNPVSVATELTSFIIIPVVLHSLYHWVRQNQCSYHGLVALINPRPLSSHASLVIDQSLL